MRMAALRPSPSPSPDNQGPPSPRAEAPAAASGRARVIARRDLGPWAPVIDDPVAVVVRPVTTFGGAGQRRRIPVVAVARAGWYPVAITIDLAQPGGAGAVGIQTVTAFRGVRVDRPGVVITIACTTAPAILVGEDGRGLCLMRRLMDRVEQFRARGNVVRLTLRHRSSDGRAA